MPQPLDVGASSTGHHHAGDWRLVVSALGGVRNGRDQRPGAKGMGLRHFS